MSARSITLAVLLVGLATVYGCFFADWFGARPATIIVSRRPGHPLNAPRDPSIPPVDQVNFGFNTKYELKSIKVVRADDLATNKYAYALWHIVAKDGSKPIKAFTYGESIKGMEPYLPGTEPDALEPNVQYVLQIEADSGNIKLQTNFFTVASRPRR